MLSVIGQLAGDSLEWTNKTTIHPIGLAMTAACGLALLALPRRMAVWPFILMACMVAPAQRLVVGGLDFNLIRLLVLFGAARVALKTEYATVRWTAVDAVIVAFALVRTLAYTVQYAEASALINQAGQSFDAVGLYFLFRCLIRDKADIVRTIVGFAAMSILVMIAFALEKQSGRNVFSVFGGVPATTEIREGRLRCQGAFSHPIIAGCFWAAMMPLFAALWWQGRVNRVWGIVGLACGAMLVVFTASSTPVMGVLFAFLGGAMFLVRWWMRWIVLAAVALGVFLHLSMKAPIWHLISRITIAKGNTGYHRFLLIDNAINHFTEWAFVGTPSTAHWFSGGQDVTNQYVLEAVRGGFLTLVLFIVTIWMCFIYAGRSWRAAGRDRPTIILSWALGVALWVHCTNFIGVSYFGQGTFIWYLHLAMIASAWESIRRAAAGAVVIRAIPARSSPRPAPAWASVAPPAAAGPAGSQRT